MRRRPTDWPTYLREFHTTVPGITEDVLNRCAFAGTTPYRWLTDGIGDDLDVLDLGCGSGPARPPDTQRWTGLDLSHEELRRAAELGRHALVRGDITRLPIATYRADVVTCSMAMMLVHPLERGLAEIRRVLRPDGELRLLLPTPGPGPLTTADRFHYLRLFWAARSTTKFPPTALDATAPHTLRSHGFAVTADEQRRFELPVETTTDAERFIASWYLPTTTTERRNTAVRRAAAMAPFSIGIPLRRITARPA